MKLVEIIREETKYLLSGRVPLLLIILGLPIFFTILFGVIYGENVVNHIPMVIYDQDQSSLSRTLIQMYTDSERYDVVSYVSTQEDMEAAINNGEALVALAIPNDFSKNVKKGIGADIMLIANSTNNMFGNAALSSAQEINRSFSVAVGQKLMEGLNQLPVDAMNATYPVHLGVRILNNPVNGYAPFMLSGLMLNGFQIGLMIAAAPVLITECVRRRYGREYSSFLVMIGKGIPYWGFGLLAYLLALVVVVHVFAVPMRGSWWDAAVLGGAFDFFVMNVMLLFSSCSRTRVLSMQMPMVYIMPGLLYSGLSWPSFDMNEIAGFLSLLLPMTYAGDNLRDILLAGYAPALWTDCAKMLLGGCITGSIALGIFSLRRRETLREGGTADGDTADHTA